MNGGTRPSTVAMPTSHGSSIRRRASLKTQNAVASQKTATKNNVRFRITAQVPELKKLKIPLSAITARSARGGSSPRESRRQTRGRRSSARRSRRPRRRSASRRAFPWYARRSDVEVGQEIEGAGDEHGAVVARQLARAGECLLGVGDGLDVCEDRLGEAGEVCRRGGPG